MSSGNINALLHCLVLSEYPLLATASPGLQGLLGRAEEKYSNARDSRLRSRTKQLHYSLGAWKEKLKDLWCLSAVPGSCCSQRDLILLWHLRARGKFLLSARGSSGRLTSISLRGQHQKAVSAALKDGAGGEIAAEETQGALACSVCK